jgi:hypothetical protein
MKNVSPDPVSSADSIGGGSVKREWFLTAHPLRGFKRAKGWIEEPAF